MRPDCNPVVIAPSSASRPGAATAPGQPRGVPGIRQVWCQLRGQFPDVCIELNDLIAEGNRVVARGTFLSGGGPLGRFLEVFQMEDGRITDVWNILTFDRGWVEYGAALWLQR